MIAVANGAHPKINLEVLTEEVSASRLNLWSQCRLKFYFKYVLKFEKAPTAALHIGRMVHSILQEWNLARWRQQEIDQGRLKELFIQNWDEEQLIQEIDWEGDEREEREEAWKLLETYFQQSSIPVSEKPRGVEVRLEADLVKHGLPRLIGILDLVRGNGVIVDFKTSKQTPDSARVAHQTEIQLTCYSVLYREATGEKEEGFELHHLVKLKTPKLVVTTLPPATDRQESRLFRVMESYMEGVRREDFVPSTGLHCASCQYFNECRRWS